MSKTVGLCPLMLMLILTACKGTPAMTPAEHNVVEALKNDLVDRCLGRYVMKVLKQAQMRSRDGVQFQPRLLAGRGAIEGASLTEGKARGFWDVNYRSVQFAPSAFDLHR